MSRAAPLLALDRASVRLGVRQILDEVSTGVVAGERVGVVGLNGGGKSTLVRSLAGLQPLDSGRLVRSVGVETALVTQIDDASPDAVVAELVALALYRRAGGHGVRPAAEDAARDPAVRFVLDGLLPTLDRQSKVGMLSGGERRRLSLASALIAAPDVLLLDEPTNHLDLEAIAWLAGALIDLVPEQGKRGLLVVTHDRWFLDAVATRTVEVVDGGLETYDGGYGAYVLARAERYRRAAVTEERRQNLMRKELAWLRRGPPARTSKPRYRIDAAEALIADEPAPRDSVALAAIAATRLGKQVLELADVSVVGGPRTLLEGVDWILGPGDRIGVLGPNGAGKTSLLRVLAGGKPAAGTVRTGSTVRLAVLGQQVEGLDDSVRVLSSVESVARQITVGTGSRARELSAQQVAENLGFRGDQLWTRVGELSGGERRRLQLARLLMEAPNLLLLDEPTNDLDTDTLAVLEDSLDGWAGTLVVVSHDRYFLERTCDRFLALMGDGRLTDLPGGVEQYLSLRGALGAAEPSASPRADGAVSSAADKREARKDLTRIERRFARLAAEETDLHNKLVSNAADHAALLTLDERLRALLSERAQLEDAWLLAAEQLEE